MPVVVDAGIVPEAAAAFELGADAAGQHPPLVSGDPVAMGRALAGSAPAGRSAYKRPGACALQAQASSPATDFLGRRESRCQ